ncbi:hypothetical protein ABPG74_018400 [Tetrahymena malaccensis]
MVFLLTYMMLKEFIRPKKHFKNQGRFEEQYEMMETISENSDTEVHIQKVRKISDNKVYCAKIFYKNVDIKRGDANEQNEIKYLKKLKHSNIVTIIEYFDDDEKIVIITEYLEITLYDVLKCYKKLSEQDVKVIAKTIFIILDHLQKHNLVHGDLVLQNFMLKKEDDQFDSLKMIDFNTVDTEENRSSIKKITNSQQFLNCQPTSLAPETIQQYIVNKQSDVWSVGIMLYTLLFGTVPFDGKNPEQIYDSILNKQPKYQLEDETGYSVNISQKCESFLKRLLHKNYEYRYSAHQALEDPWLCEES